MKKADPRFKYGEVRHNGRRGLQFGLPVFVAGALLPFLAHAASNIHVPALIGGLVLALVVFFVTSRENDLIIIGRRFIVVGQDIFYYRNLTQVKVDPTKQVLALFKGSYPVCVIKAAGFPTNARHEDKIAKNRRQKFAKVETKLLARLAAAAPETPIIRQESLELP